MEKKRSLVEKYIGGKYSGEIYRRVVLDRYLDRKPGQVSYKNREELYNVYSRAEGGILDKERVGEERVDKEIVGEGRVQEETVKVKSKIELERVSI